MSSEVDVAIVGAGFSGLYQLYRLRQEGFVVHLFEADSGLGGVWNSNRYPGARVDSHVPNYEYSIEAVWRDWNWTERFPGGDELRQYFQHVDEVLDLSRDISLNTRIESARFNELDHRWLLTTASGQQIAAQFVIMCTGFASKPYVPEFPGLGDFEGECHHTARWPESGTSFTGHRVGVIGTGASGVQIVQEASKDAAELVVFQRNPVTALPMQQRRLSVNEQLIAKASYRATFKKRNSPPGTMTDVHHNGTGALEVSAARRAEVFEDAWQKGGFHFWVGTFNDILFDDAASRFAYDFWRDKTRARIEDPAIADFLAPMEPPYAFGSKRPSLEQGYYEAFNQANVRLVDLKQTPIERITPTSVRTAAEEFELDMLVLATGFDANTGGLTQIDIIGTDGKTLGDRWKNGVQTNFGLSASGYPNLLFMYGPQSPTAFCNGPTCAELQGEWIVELLAHLRAEGLTRIESTEAAEQAWTDQLVEIAAMTTIGKTDSWYMSANIPGKPRQLLNYPNTDEYLRQLAECRNNGFAGFELSR